MRRSTLISLLLLTTLCLGADPYLQSWQGEEPMTYENLSAWHEAGGLRDWPWPKAQYLALTDNKAQEEALLAVSGFYQGMIYALFTATKAGRWRMLSDNIEGSDQPFEVLPTKHGGWHDFCGVVASGQGGFFRILYSFNGRRYVPKFLVIHNPCNTFVSEDEPEKTPSLRREGDKVILQISFRSGRNEEADKIANAVRRRATGLRVGRRGRDFLGIGITDGRLDIEVSDIDDAKAILKDLCFKSTDLKLPAQ